MGVSVTVARGVPAGPGVAEPDCAATRSVNAVAVALMARSSSAIEGLEGGVGPAAAGLAEAGTTEPGSELGLARGGGGLAAVIGVICCTATGGPAWMVKPGVGCGVKPPTAGTGVDGSGVAVVVGVFPPRVELTIWRLVATLGAGVGLGAAAPNTPVTLSRPKPTATAPATARLGPRRRFQAGGGFCSVTRQARGLGGVRRALRRTAFRAEPAGILLMEAAPSGWRADRPQPQQATAPTQANASAAQRVQERQWEEWAGCGLGLSLVGVDGHHEQHVGHHRHGDDHEAEEGTEAGGLLILGETLRHKHHANPRQEHKRGIGGEGGAAAAPGLNHDGIILARLKGSAGLPAAAALLGRPAPVASALAAYLRIVLAAMAGLGDFAAHAAELHVIGAALLQRVSALAADFPEEVHAVLVADCPPAIFAARRVAIRACRSQEATPPR